MEKILIIDDEPEIIDTLNGFFSARGYSVTSAKDSVDGIAKFDSENPDLVICDINMPNKDGFQFLKEIRTNKRWVPVIILSALTEPANVLKSYDLEADYYISKPMKLDEILKAVQIMLSLAPMRRK